jgi:hypothetical protein
VRGVGAGAAGMACYNSKQTKTFSGVFQPFRQHNGRKKPIFEVHVSYLTKDQAKAK